MKAQAKLIKFNRIKMWLVTQHDFKVAILNDRKQSVLRVLGHRTHKVDQFVFVYVLFAFNLLPFPCILYMILHISAPPQLS